MHETPETRVEENTHEKVAEISTEGHGMTSHERFVLNAYSIVKKVRNAFPWEKLRRQLSIFDDDEFESIIEEFKRFIAIKAVEKDFGRDHTITLSPSGAIDLVWHATMLRPRDYVNMCFHVCGDYIDHNPDGANDTQDKKQARYENTLRAYEKMFLQKPQTKFWPSVKNVEPLRMRQRLLLDVSASSSQGETTLAEYDFRDDGSREIWLSYLDENAFRPSVEKEK